MAKRLFISILFLFGILPLFMHAQVSELNYFLEYNSTDSTYDMYIKIIKGISKTAPQRAQFNSQVSIVTPTKNTLKIIRNHMPLQGNNSYTGTAPLWWTISSSVISPSVTPKFDYYSITPTLSPTCFYNDLYPGDEVKLFTFKISPQPTDIESVRLFDNEKDPKSNQAGMGGGDFSQTFTIGGVHQDYIGNLPLRTETTSIIEQSIDKSVSISPNPFTNSFDINTTNLLVDASVYDYYGRKIGQYNEGHIETSAWLPGLYIISIGTDKGISIIKAIKY